MDRKRGLWTVGGEPWAAVLFAAVVLASVIAGCGCQANPPPGTREEGGGADATRSSRDEGLGEGCRRVSFEPNGLTPQWTRGQAVTWDLEEKGLVVADLGTWKILHVELDGDVARAREAFPELKKLDFSSTFKQAAGLLLGLLGDDRFLRYNDKHQITELIDTHSPVGAFTVYADAQSVLAIGRDQSTGTKRIGLFRIPFDGIKKTRLLYEFPGDGEAALDAYRTFLGTFVTSIGGRAAMLLMERWPHVVVEEEDGMRVLEQTSKSLPSCGLCGPAMDWQHYDEYVGLLKEISVGTMPRGLVGWGGDLYVVVRRPWENGDWRLLRVDPVKDEILGEVLVPSRAEVLFVLPGHEQWAFIEVGRIPGFPVMDDMTILLTPKGGIVDLEGEGRLCSGQK